MPTRKGRIIVGVTYYAEQIAAADKLLTLADQHPAEATTLAASAALVLVVGLEQAISIRLKIDLAGAQLQKNEKEQTEIELLLRSSLWHRIRMLPEYFSAGSLKLAIGPVSGDLRGLVVLRNMLVHVDEEYFPFDGVETEIDPAIGDPISFPGLQEVAEKFPDDLAPNPWQTCRPQTVRRLEKAVRQYIKEVLDTYILKPGGVLVPTPQGGGR